MKKKYVIWAIIILVIGGVIFLRVQSQNKLKYTSVKTTKAVKGDIKSYLSTTASIKSKNSKDYYGLSGKVSAVNVKVGDTVKIGEVLVKYDTPDLNSSVKQAQIQYDNAALAKQSEVNANNDMNSKMADLDKQIADLDAKISAAEASKNPQDIANVSALQSQSLQLKQTRDSLKLPFSNEQLKQADNSIALAKITLDNAKTSLAKNSDSITADFDGVITAVNAVVGSTGNPAMAAITIQDLSNLKGVISVGKYDAAKLSLGQTAIIKTQNNQYNGKVSFIDPAAKQTVSASGTDSSLNVEIDIANPGNDLKVGFDNDVDILLGEASKVLMVPVEAIKTDKNDKNYIYVIQGNKAYEKEVKLGIQSDTDVQIISGVNEGDSVILNPSASIHDGSFVKESGVGK
ncbi:efflux RND transporter periplasmic adaptor subunit [Candidatus Clostridium radicumherbarum]|uniref:Efflux RND transporter periplasmic adaptor subunit n=1 Tax=Candidatus Clostridium radicumherbarum TaxID=3381662 RepID=A0ABW8TLZ3_9CLOT